MSICSVILCAVLVIIRCVVLFCICDIAATIYARFSKLCAMYLAITESHGEDTAWSSLPTVLARKVMQSILSICYLLNQATFGLDLLHVNRSRP